jgi:hypothetical protein
MSHGEGWRFLMLGAIWGADRRLLEVMFGDGREAPVTDRIALMACRMGCALEPLPN